MKIELFDADALNFVEFNTTGDDNTYIRCDEESKYIDTVVFNLFIDCFEKSNKLYDYFDATKFNARNFIPLIHELERKVKELEKISSEEAFEEYLHAQFLGKEFISKLDENDNQWRNNWLKYRKKLLRLSEDIKKLVQKCINKEKVLWVIGY